VGDLPINLLSECYPAFQCPQNNKQSFECFFLATYYIQVASLLLEHGASLTATTKKGFTPLHLAAKYGNLNVAKLLLQKDAPVDAQGKVIKWLLCN
jgi:ankyrin repeat protein